MLEMEGAMRRIIDCGRQPIAFDLDEGRLLGRPRDESPPVEPVATLLAALEKPHGFPPLRQALTPGDRVTVVLDEELPQLGRLLTPLLEYLVTAGVDASDMTLLCPSSTSTQSWVDELPEYLEEARVEVHDPRDRKRLSYLATSREGRRLYLNRSLVDADQIVVLSRRWYDPLLGYGGAEGMIYPGLCDEETRTALNARLTLDAPGEAPWPTRQEAIETAWLLGLPFFVQVIEGTGDGVAQVVGGAAEASVAGQHALDRRWRQSLSGAAALVVAGLGADSADHSFADLAAAALCASRVVEPEGRIILLTEGVPDLSAAEPIAGVDEPGRAVETLRDKPTPATVAAWQWATAAAHARLYLLSGLDAERTEDLWATPLRNAAEVQRLLEMGGRCLFLDDAHRALTVLE
jgi:nickel-dependent lactate racemase